MRALALICLLAAASPSSSAADRVPPEEYRARRQALRESLAGDAFLLKGATEDEYGDLRTRFFQESGFYYLTGWTEPGALLAIAPAAEALFLPRRNTEREKWTGHKAAAGDDNISQVTGFDDVRDLDELDDWLTEHADTAAKFRTVAEQPLTPALNELLPDRQFADATAELTRLRMRKSPAELALLRRSAAITAEAHRAAWRRMAPGLYEYQLAATMTGVYLDAGCERSAYAPIVASGPRAVILHYTADTRRIHDGELVLMDVGAECSCYATDLTRTVPANGRFTRRQRELYDIVLGAQKAVIAAVKPGMDLSRDGPNSLYRVALRYLDEHGLGRYFTHHVSHHVGLDVHDPDIADEPLAPGMVITVEPGVYLPDENIGIRIEDMVLVTEDGAEVLSAELPTAIAEIEKAMRARN